MHLLQSGVDIAVITLWFGHESIETTHGYLEADLKLKSRRRLFKSWPQPARPLQGLRLMIRYRPSLRASDYAE